MIVLGTFNIGPLEVQYLDMDSFTKLENGSFNPISAGLDDKAGKK